MIQNLVFIFVVLTGAGMVHSTGQDICTECEQIVGTVHLLLSNNETETEVLNAMNQICKMLPQEYGALCDEAVTEYGRQLIDGLVKYLADPKQLCTVIGFCSGDIEISREDAYKMLQQLRQGYVQRGVKVFDQKFKNEGMSECASCEFVLDILQTTLADQPMIDFFKEEVDKLCNLLPTNYRGECRSLIIMFEPHLYEEFVRKYLDPINFCTGVRVCPANA